MEIKIGDYLRTVSGRWFRITHMEMAADGGDMEEVGGIFSASRGTFEVYGDGYISGLLWGKPGARSFRHYTPFEYELLKIERSF